MEWYNTIYRGSIIYSANLNDTIGSSTFVTNNSIYSQADAFTAAFSL